MTLLEKAEFKTMVDKSSWHLNVLVHPWFEENNSDSQYPVTSDYKQARANLIQSCLENGVPLVIFEEGRNYWPLIGRFAFQNKGILHLVRTGKADTEGPTPESNHKFSFKRLSREDRWRPVLDVLGEAGVKHVTVGGRYLTLDRITDERFLNDYQKWVDSIEGFNQRTHAKAWLGKDFLPQGCVAGAAHWLLTRFDVSLSPVSSPYRLPVMDGPWQLV